MTQMKQNKWTGTATARHIVLKREGATQAGVYDGNFPSIRIGTAERERGFIFYTGASRSAHQGMRAVVASDGPDYSALVKALAEGLRNGRDDRN